MRMNSFKKAPSTKRDNCSVDKIKHSDSLMKLYTGIDNFLKACPVGFFFFLLVFVYPLKILFVS